MRFSSILQQMVPPIFFRFLKLLRAQSAPSCASWGAASRLSIKGYEDHRLTELVFYRTRAFRDSPAPRALNLIDLNLVAAVARAVIAAGSLPVRVIDFGGACGNHYFAVKAVFPNVVFDWKVIETPSMTATAKALESGELHFFSELSDACDGLRPHLVHTSGTLQCIPDPNLVLQQLLNLRANLVLLNRLGLSDTEQTVFSVHVHQLKDNGRGSLPPNFQDEKIAYPFQFPPRGELERILQQSYRILYSIEDASGVFPVGSHRLVGISYLAEWGS